MSLPSFRTWMVVFSALGVLVPFVVVEFPPITDLPQHMRQAQMIGEYLSGNTDGLEFRWFTPYLTVYAIPFLLQAVFGALSAASLSVGLLGVLWVVSLHGIARSRERSALAALLVAPVFFNLCLYWGFLSYFAGFPAFALLFWYSTRGEQRHSAWQRGATYLGLLALLYYTHALWFAAGSLWLGLHWLFFRRTLADFLQRTLGPLPVVFASLLWYLFLSESNFQSPTRWDFDVHRRIALDWMGATTFVATDFWAEWLILTLVAAWALASVSTRWLFLREELDYELLLAAAVFGIAAFGLPDFYQNTIGFAYRWMPPALIFLVLALPTPKLSRRWLAIPILTAFGVFVVATAARWSDYETRDLDGLHAALAEIPADASVLGLPYVERSRALGKNELYQWRPYLHMNVWLQLETRGKVNFSFADFPVMPVGYDPARIKGHTRGLEWSPHAVKRRDFEQFDFTLIGAAPEKHRQLASKFGLEAVTEDRTWRLYRADSH